MKDGTFVCRNGFGPESLVTGPSAHAVRGFASSAKASAQDANLKSFAKFTSGFTSIIPQTFGLRSIRYNNAGMTVKNSVLERSGWPVRS
jgi:hypothetical protein